ncbi:MAG: rod shape-determining protein [Clostridiales bacterium]|jgi:rod shape-determining protein MreB|nr:rod shape-determining protein [Clostridiales bacterium]
MVIDIVIDMGSENIKILRRGSGLVLNEPALALVDKESKKLALNATGFRAKKVTSEMLDSCVPVHPIKNAAVSDEEIAVLLFKDFFEKINIQPTFFNRLRVIALVGCGLTYGDRKVIARVMKKAGASRTYVIDGLFSLYSYADVKRGFFVDLGGAAANMGFVSTDGLVAGCQSDLAGNALNELICNLADSKYSLVIGNRTAEKVKLASGGLNPEKGRYIPVNGKDKSGGGYITANISAADIARCIAELADKLALLINSVLVSLPEDDYNFVCKNGIHLAGGTANINGLPEYLAEKLKLKVCVVKDGEEAPAAGGVRFYEEKGFLKKLIK